MSALAQPQLVKDVESMFFRFILGNKVFQGLLKDVLRVNQRCFNCGVLKMFLGSFKGVSRVFYKYFKNISITYSHMYQPYSWYSG